MELLPKAVGAGFSNSTGTASGYIKLSGGRININWQ